MPPVSPVVSPSRNAEDAEVKQRPVSLTPPAQTNSKPPPRVGVLSRSSSITSAVTAPVVSKTAERKPSANRVQVERRASLGDKSMGGGSGTGKATGHIRSGSNGSLGDGPKGKCGSRFMRFKICLRAIHRNLALHADHRSHCKYLADEYRRRCRAGEQGRDGETESEEESFYG